MIYHTYMNKQKVFKPIDFQEYLAEELKDPQFKKYYDYYGVQLEIAYQLLHLRKQKGLSQKQLAKMIGTKQSNVARMESGNQNFSLSMLQTIATAFNRELKIEFAK
ncbi:helix-turn-helix transcriptional regulator [Candidatus Uhrbacteria bacterium]|nr:helix-turn-helix transcriptional regulator [Candidatus Uhrbacteria bacterium]